MKAKLVASAVTVICPKCDTIAPAPDNGSDNWMSLQLAAVAGAIRCGGCGVSLSLPNAVTRVAVNL